MGAAGVSDGFVHSGGAQTEPAGAASIYVFAAADGTFVASIPRLPGCMARAKSRDEAIARAREVFRDYLELLRSRGLEMEHVRELDPAAFEVREPEERNTFPEDFAAVHAHELRDFLHQYEATYAALLDLLASRSQEELERKPGREEYSVRDCLEHIAATEAALLSRLEAWPQGGFASVKAVHRLVAQRFGVMEPQDTAGERRISGQRWSARKVMRRLLEHQYEHLRQIRDVLGEAGRAGS